ncbi:MAG: ADP-ribosylation factor-like protein [Candidatus Heimdallarchaeota archaeon]
MSSAEEEILSRKKLLMMGLSEAGKTTIRRVVISGNPPEELKKYDATLDFERDTKKIAGESLTILDIGGQESFLEKYTGEMAEFAFSGVASLIYVVDIADLSKLPRSKYYLDAALSKLEQFSPDAQVFCFIHKKDLINAESLQSTLDMVKSMMKANIPKEIKFYSTSIYDGSVFAAMSEAVAGFFRKKEEIIASLKRFADKYETVRISVYSREGIPITTLGKDSNVWQVNEKMLFSSMFRILNLIESTETLVSNFIIGRTHYIFQVVVDENTLLSAATTKTPALEQVLADVYAMRDDVKLIVQ